MISARLTLIAIVAGALLLSHGAAYWLGRAAAEANHAKVAAADNSSAAAANAAVAEAVNRAGGNSAVAAAAFAREASDARREIERHAAPPAPGRVGASALVDPALARPVLCRVERLRGVAEGSACADDAAHRAE